MKSIRNINTFRAFRNRNYSLYFSGQGISQIGTWMQRTGVTWVVYEMTNSKFMLGLTVFASQFPSFVFSLYGGILADRYDRYKLLLITQIASMIQAILLAVLAFTHQYTVTQLLILSLVLGIINAFDLPARQPMVHQMINDKADLPNALAFNSTVVNLARVIGPALSGIVLEKFGAGVCFLLNAISFVAVIGSLLLMKLPKYEKKQVQKNTVKELADGFNYLKQTPAISIVLLMLAIVSLLILPYETVLPVYAIEIFGGSASTFGFIRSFIGVGAISGALFLASMKPGTDLKNILLVNTVILGIGLAAFSHITNFPLAMGVAVIFGFGAMMQTTICLTIVQAEVSAHMRGRVLSYLGMAFFGMMPLGSLLVGIASEHTGAQNTILAEGILAVIVAAVFSKFLRKDKMDAKKIKEVEESENTTIPEV